VDTKVTATYCLTDEMLQASDHTEPWQRTFSDAEVLTTALVAADTFGGSFVKARAFLKSVGYMPDMLSKSQFNRRLHKAAPLLRLLFFMLAEVHKTRESEKAREDGSTDESVYLVDSFPVAVCDNIRIDRCKLYEKEEYRGYTASKRRFFYGLKIHVLVTSSGDPVEVFFTPGNRNDTRALKQFDFDLPDGSTVHGDKAYNDYDFEDLLAEAAEINLSPLRKKNSKRKESAPVRFLQHLRRKRVETAGSDLEKKLPASIHAVTSEGFELKTFLFVLSMSFDGLM
jgi:hypothetical protein